MSVPLPKEMEDHFTCSSCGFLISFGPVTKSSEGYQCGRCSNQDEEECNTYKTLASAYIFPCKYENSGCFATIAFGEKMKYHEMSCLAIPYMCPMAPRQDCKWKGMFHQMEKHFNAIHDAVVLENLKLEVNLEELTETRYVYFYTDSVFFFIDLSFDKDKGLMVEVMRVLRNEKVKTRIDQEYTVELCHRDNKLSFTRTISKYFLDSNTMITNNTVIDVTGLNCTDKSSITMNVTLKLLTSSLTSGEITKKTIFVCKNRTYGCNYMSCFDSFQWHQTTCVVLKCPLENYKCDFLCLWNSMINHFKDKHNIKDEVPIVLKLDEILASEKTTIVYAVLKPVCNYSLCRVCIKLVNIGTADSSMYIAAQYFSKPDRRDSNRQVLFKDSNGLESKISVPFVPFTSEENVFKNSTHIYLEHLNLNGSTLTIDFIK